MRKFRSIETGAILVPNNKMVIEQLANSKYYEEIGAKASKENTETKKAIKDYTKKELVALLKSLGIEDVNEDMKKDDLLAVVPEDYKAE